MNFLNLTFDLRFPDNAILRLALLSCAERNIKVYKNGAAGPQIGIGALMTSMVPTALTHIK